MNNRYSRFICTIFVAFIAVFFVLHLVLSDKASSENENRTLAQLPAFSVSTLLSGDYMSDMETYLADQFPLRDNWIALKADIEVASGKSENNGIYICGQTLISKVDEPDYSQVDKNLAAVDTLAENSDVPVYFALIPTAAEILSGRLPDNAPTFDEAALINSVKDSTKAEFVDLLTAFTPHSGEDIYYRTDHHWTTLGAYYGYKALLEQMGIDAPALADYEKTLVSDSFYGTLYSTSGVRSIKPDSIYTFVSGDGLTVTSYADGTPKPSSLYNDSALEKKNKYTYFLGGNQPLCIIENPDAATDMNILFIRDSYADTEAQFLSQTFSSVHLMDLRYNRTSVAQYIADNDIDAVVVSYSVSNFITDKNLFLAAK